MPWFYFLSSECVVLVGLEVLLLSSIGRAFSLALFRSFCSQPLLHERGINHAQDNQIACAEDSRRAVRGLEKISM